MNRFDEAVVFAVLVHSGQRRKGTNIPYILHPMEAAAIVGSMTNDPDIIAAAVLHDTAEDAGVSIDEIAARFGRRVSDLVKAETEDKRESLPAADTWQLRKQETIDALGREKDIAVKMLVIGDKLSNIRAMYRDYLSLGDRLWERFNQKDPKKHAWYYRAIAEVTTELKEYPAWQEYSALVEKVFS